MSAEINRVLIEHISTLLFSPTETALQIQRNGGIGDAKVRVEGHVIYDATLYNKGLNRKPEGFDTLNITMHDPSSRKH